MKTAVGIGIGIFIVFMAYVFIGGFLQKQSLESSKVQNNTTQAPSSASTTTQYAVSDVAKHNNQESCWLIISNNVYDVTTYLADHPGGASAILTYCGQEATRAFETQDKSFGGGHSSMATRMLASYQIGVLR